MVVSYTERKEEKLTMTDTVGCRFTASAMEVYTGIRVSALQTKAAQRKRTYGAGHERHHAITYRYPGNYLILGIPEAILAYIYIQNHT